MFLSPIFGLRVVKCDCLFQLSFGVQIVFDGLLDMCLKFVEVSEEFDL